MKELSIVIPVYNSEKWLRGCLTSVVNQTIEPTDVEIIVIDDGSTDNSYGIINEFSKTYSNIKIVTKENGGVSSARNVGIELAQGKYITFIDSDDYIDKNFCKNMLDKANDADVVSCGHDSYYYGKFKKRYEIKPSLNYEQHNAICDFFQKKNCAHIVVTKMFKLELIKKYSIRFVEGRLYEDMMFAFEINNVAQTFTHINESLYTYWRRENSLSGITSRKKFEDYMYAIEKILETTIKNYGRDLFKEEIIYWMLCNCLSLAKLWAKTQEVSKDEFNIMLSKFEDIIDMFKYGC